MARSPKKSTPKSSGINLVKLCVGISSIEEMQAWTDFRREESRKTGKLVEHIHTTRMMPKQAQELLDGGSLYWVIKGNIQIRQIITDIRERTDKEGIKRCDLVFEPRLIPTHWQPRRPFQGWRYLKGKDAPSDLDMREGSEALPPDLQLELSELGLL